MKQSLVLIYTLLTALSYLSAQNNEYITVKAGTRALDYFPFEKRYKYPEFLPGKVLLNSGVSKDAKLNYNILQGEIQFIHSKDTLNIGNKKDIRLIIIASDTFYYDDGYLELIYNSLPIKVTQKHYIKLQDIRKKDAYGLAKSGSSTKSFRDLPFDGNFYDLVVNEDVILQNRMEYYVSTSESGFLPFRKKALGKLFPQKSNTIKNYIKSNNVDFDSRDDIIRLAGFISNL
jgi:hypothetical protein